MEPSSQELVAAMQEAVAATPSLKSKFNASVEFQLTGSESFRLDMSKSKSRKDKTDLIVIASLEVFHKLLNKKLTPQQAFMQGKLKIKGKMGLAMKLTLILNATRKVLQKNRSRL
jgi:putative sterol carrier protein